MTFRLHTKTESELDNEVCRFWERKTETPLERVRALRPMAAYYFFVKNDVMRAVTYWREWMISTYLNSEIVRTVHLDTTANLSKTILSPQFDSQIQGTAGTC